MEPRPQQQVDPVQIAIQLTRLETDMKHAIALLQKQNSRVDKLEDAHGTMNVKLVALGVFVFGTIAGFEWFIR